MATKITAPAAAVFTSDPLEQVFARDMFANNNKGGLAAMMLNAAGDRRDADQQSYMDSLGRANEATALIERMQEAFKFRSELAKTAASLAPHGFLPSTLSGGSDLFNGNPAAGDAAAKLLQALTIAKTNEANSAAANAGSGNIKVSTDYGPGGVGYTRVDTRGPTVGAAAAAQEQAKQELLKKLLIQGGTMDPRQAAERNAIARQPGAQ